MIAVLAAILALQSVPAPKLANVVALSPRAAGDLVLRGEAHAPIASVEPLPRVGLMLADESELALVEQPVTTSQGCVRGRWIVVFMPDRSSNDPTPRVQRMRKTTEIGRSTPRGCSTSSYVGLGNGLVPADGFAALARLERLSDGRAKVAFACSDELQAGLCVSDRSIRRAISEQQAWLVMRRGADDVFWLGRRGGTVTEVRIDRANPDRVVVRRIIPAPA